MSDRIAGLFFAALAVWYGLTASSFESGFGDPLGPAMFPELVAVPFAIFSVFLILRPDPDPTWVTGTPLLRQAMTLVVLFGYGLSLERLGFPLATAIGSAMLCRLLGAAWLPAALAGIGMGLGLYLIFDPLLGLPLPFLPDW
jgi:putative tricarboxylic transport membrane protein